jgi:hypothetical protein
VGPVDQHHGDVGGLKLRRLGVGRSERHEQHAVHPPAQRPRAEALARLLGPLDVEHDQLVAGAGECMRGSPHALHDAGLREERRHDADGHRATGRQRACDRVRPIVERGDGIEHASTRGLAHGWGAVEHT